MPRFKKIIIAIIVFFVVFTIVGFFVLPPIVKSILTKKLSENLHRQVTINQLKINPYILSLTVKGFVIKERESSEIFVSFDELYLNLQSFSIIRMALIIKEISLKNPYINISRKEDESYNFSDLLEKNEPEPAEKTAKKPKPLRFSLNNIRIENGSIDFWDGPKQTKHTIRELNIGVPFLSNIPSHINIFVQPSFSAKINDTPYKLQGSTKPFAESLETVFDININNLDIPYYLAYLPMKLNFKIISAFLDVQTKISFIQYRDKGPSLAVTGDVALKKLALDDDKKNPLFRLPLLEVGIAPSEPLKKIFHLSKISLQSPEIEIKRDKTGAINISSLLPEKNETSSLSESKKEEEKTPLLIDIDEIQLTGGKVSFSDASRDKPFKTILNPIELKVEHFSNRKDQKTAYKLLVYSEVKENVKLEGELSIDPLGAEGGLEIKSIPLKKYSPYYQDQILFNLEEGRLDFSTRYKYIKGEKEAEILLSRMSAVLNSLRLKKPDEVEDFLKIPVLSIKDTLVDITQKKLTIGAFFTEKGNIICNRLKNGDFDLLKLFPPSPPKEPPLKQDKEKEEEKKWVVTLNRLYVDQYSIKMGDLSLSQPTTLTGEKINLLGENISTAKNASGKLSLSFQLDQTGTLFTKNIIVIDPLKIQGSLEVNHLLLKKYAPYYQDKILFNIEGGELDISTNFQYQKSDKDSEAKLSGLTASLKNLKLKKREEQDEFLNIPSLTIQNTIMDLNRKEISIGDFSTQRGSFFVQRLKDGKLNLQTLFPEPEKKDEKAVIENVGKIESPWVIKVGKVSVEDYQIKGEDQTPTESVTMMVDKIYFKGNNLSTAERQKGNISLALRLNQRGIISTEGTIGINPISANLKMSLKEIELKPFESYFTDKVKITITSGSLSTAGNFTLEISEKKELKASFRGGASLNHFASIDKLKAVDVLKLESLVFDNIQFNSTPFLMDIKGIALNNFYALVFIDPDGKINLKEILAKGEVKKETPSKEEAPTAEKKEDRTPKKEEPSKNIKIGNINLQGGRIDFTDKSVAPEFSAKLTEIGGKVSGLSSEETSLGEVELRAKLNEYAPLEIVGKINPLKQDLYVDLKACFKDMDLSPLTPYSGKYAGYTIQKGKLSFDLKYLIDKRKLDAQNIIFIDQFNFGDKVESPHATKLPVKLAIALLKDRKGEIKLDIPVSGSLDDPKFSVWGIILKIILNLIVKAATSPFALLGAIFGGGEELSYLEFDYGMAMITETNMKKIDLLVKALSDRPTLKLDIEGHVDLERDREALKQVFFQRKLKAQKLKEMVKKGVPAIPVDEVKIEKQEYEKYLRLAYKEEKFPKPRNIIGIAKELPIPETEKLIFAHIEIKENDLRALASQRAMSVKDAILKTGKVEPERIFILEPKTLEPEKKENLKDSRINFILK